MQKLHNRLLKALQKKKAVIWDFDGVLCYANWHYDEDFSVWWDSLWQLLEEYDPIIRKRFRNGLTYPYEHTDYIVQQCGQKALRKINQFYLQKELRILSVSPINNQIVSLIQDLHEEVEQYIWSNNQEVFIVKKLEEMKIVHEFKKIVSRDKVLLAKPHLDGFEIIRTVTNIPVRDFLFVGDSTKTDKVVAETLRMDFFHYIKDT